MTAVHLPADKPFFSQWTKRGSKPRTLESARALTQLLSFTPPPSLAVVGSKGKGTAAAAASAMLADSGLITVSITSPAFRTNRERIRLNGEEISPQSYDMLSNRLAQFLPMLPSEHYLSPTGAYTIMGAWLAADIAADVLVIEEGMGGSGDEVSLFEHTGLIVTPIFLEHAGILGENVEEIAANLLGAGSDSVQVIASAAQRLEVGHLVRLSAQEWGAELLSPLPAQHRNPLVGENIGLGFAAGRALAERLGGVPQDHRELNLPGRSSLHRAETGMWFVDAAISPAGVRAALSSCPLSSPRAIVSWPLSKDRDGCSDLVPHALHVRVPGLEYPKGLPTFAEVAGEIDGNVLALGTISFIAEVLEHLKAPTNLW